MHILHFDTLNNAGVYWSKHLQRQSRFYQFVLTKDTENIDEVKYAISSKPTHLVFGGGFYSAKPEVLSILSNYVKNNDCNTFSYYGDAFLSKEGIGFTQKLHELGICQITYCSSVEAVSKIVSKGYTAEFSPHPVDCDVFRPWNLPKIYDWNFTGNHQPDRHPILETAKSAGLKHIIRGLGHIEETYLCSYEEAAIIYNQSKITLTITAPRFQHLSKYFSDRLGMGMCAGSFSLTNYQPQLEELFHKGLHLDWYTNNDELVEKIKWYSEHDSEREKIARHGYERGKLLFDMATMLSRFLNRPKPKTVDVKAEIEKDTTEQK